MVIYPTPQITRMFSDNEFTSKDLWHEVKPLVRSYETDDVCLIFDDTIIPKPYMDMDENEICWHCDYSHGRNEKGINRLTAFYHSQPFNASETLRVPVSYECVKKTVHYCDCDLKARKEKRQSEVSKNDGVLRNITNRLNKNASLAKSPARTVTTQGNHLFASLAAYVKLERLKLVHKLNHFALKAKIYWAVSKDAWSELKKIKLEASA